MLQSRDEWGIVWLLVMWMYSLLGSHTGLPHCAVNSRIPTQSVRLSPQKWTLTLWGINLTRVFGLQPTLMDKHVQQQLSCLQMNVSLFCWFLLHRLNKVVFFFHCFKHSIVTSNFSVTRLTKSQSCRQKSVYEQFFIFTVFTLTKPLKVWCVLSVWVGLGWRTTQALQWPALE